jgi:hypothetical protein
MRIFSNKLWWCLAFGLLFFVAATADLMATSIISDSHNANNPPVRIEHKSVGLLNKSVSLEKSHTSHIRFAAISISTPVQGKTSLDHNPFHTASCLLFVSVPSITPLRC